MRSRPITLMNELESSLDFLFLPGFLKMVEEVGWVRNFFLGLGRFDIRLGRDDGKLVIGGKMK